MTLVEHLELISVIFWLLIILFFSAMFMLGLYVAISKIINYITKGMFNGNKTEADVVHGQVDSADQKGDDSRPKNADEQQAGETHDGSVRDEANVAEVPGDIQPAPSSGVCSPATVEGFGKYPGDERKQDTGGAPVSDSNTRRIPRRPPAHVRQAYRRAASTEDTHGSWAKALNAFIEVFGRGK